MQRRTDRTLSRILSGTRPSVQTVSDVCLRRICLLDTSAFSALEVLDNYCAISRIPCTKVLSQEIQIFQETSFCVLQVLLLDFTNTIWQLYIDFYTTRIVFESFFQLYIFKVANLKKLWQFWQKYVDRTFVHVKHGAV